MRSAADGQRSTISLTFLLLHSIERLDPFSSASLHPARLGNRVGSGLHQKADADERREVKVGFDCF